MHFQLETGRTHQIRVHSAYIGHPIVKDPLYSSGKDIKVNLPGQALHAWKLQLLASCNQPSLISVTAPLPAAFLTLLEVLRRRTSAIIQQYLEIFLLYKFT